MPRAVTASPYPIFAATSRFRAGSWASKSFSRGSRKFLEQAVNVGFASLPLGAYRVQWVSNLTDGSWNTLIVTNVSGPGGWLQIPDPNTAAQSQKFYRVQTPP
jgi:hypothetical protein